jgi:hypothetical protein
MVLYADLAARELAFQVHDELMLRFAGEVEFWFKWYRFDYLADPEIAREAAWDAVSADVMLVSLRQLEDVSLTVKAWFETWLPKRPAGEGVLAVIRGLPPSAQAIMRDDAYLRLAARRANLDYLPLWVPPPIPQNVDKLRADAALYAAAGFKNFSTYQYPSSDWGLNE